MRARCSLVAVTVIALLSAGCKDGNTEPAPASGTAQSTAVSAGSAAAGGVHTSNLPKVVTNTPKITEAQFMKALDEQLDKVFKDIKGKTFRSRAQLSAELGSRLGPKMMIRATSKAMGVTDVSVLSLFAKNPGVSKRVGERIKARSKTVVEQLTAQLPDLPMVVKEDCREAAAKGLSLKQLAEGKRRATPDDRRDAPLVGQLLLECKKLSETQPELKCYVEAADEAALAACK